MASKPKSWKFNIQHLSAQKRNKRFSTRQLLKELESLGLVEKKRITDQKGRVKEWNFQLNPESNFRILDTIPESNFQIVDNQTQAASKSPESNFPEVGNSTSGKLDTSNKREEETKEKNKKSGSTLPQKSFKTYSLDEFKKEVEISAKDKVMTETTMTAFLNYWTEKSASGKMKFQLQDTWETPKRLDTWICNQAKFQTKGGWQSPKTSINEVLEKKKNIQPLTWERPY